MNGTTENTDRLDYIPQNPTLEDMPKIVENIQKMRDGYEWLTNENIKLVNQANELQNIVAGLSQANKNLEEKIEELSKEKLNQKVKLNYYEGDTEKSFKVSTRFPSAFVRSELLRIQYESMEKLQELSKQFQVKETTGGPDLNIKENAAIEMLNATALNAKIQYLSEKIGCDTKIEMLKIIIDDKQLPTEHKGLVREPVSSEFWQNVYFSEVEIALNSFRSHYKI